MEKYIFGFEGYNRHCLKSLTQILSSNIEGSKERRYFKDSGNSEEDDRRRQTFRHTDEQNQPDTEEEAKVQEALERFKEHGSGKLLEEEIAEIISNDCESNND